MWTCRTLLSTLILLSGVISHAAAAPVSNADGGADTASADKPNILLIFTDDHGFADLGCQQVRRDVRTPHIDALVAGGMRMANGYVTAPQCVPSRAGLISGRYQNRFGVESNGKSLDGFDRQQTIAERLKSAGYATGMTGKWHLGPGPQIPSHGFDDVFYKHSNAPGWANFDLQGNTTDGGPERSGLYHLEANAAAACSFIRRHHDQSFFFYLAFRAPHVPLDPPEKYLKRFPGAMPERRRKALAMLSAVDDGVGRVMATLREFGLESRTLIFLIADNGAPLKIHKLDAPGGGPGWDGSLNEPLNGEKGMLAEGGIRVPWVVAWKDHLPAGVTYDAPVISLDVAATAIALAGLPHDPQLDGVNLVPFLTDPAIAAGKPTSKRPHDALYWRWVAQSAVREGNWKYLRGGDREYLYDLAQDAEEKHNVIRQQPEVARRLRDRLQRWADALEPPGLATGKMSTVWESYYDYYLDGKPAPPLRDKFKPARDDQVQGWIARNSKLQATPTGLRVSPRAGKGKAHPFLAVNGLKLPRQVTVAVRTRAHAAGQLGIAWREKGQSDFVAGQVATTACSATDEFQDYRISVEAEESIIHIRLLLPDAGAEIERVAVLDAQGHTVKQWRFRSPATGRGQQTIK